jgi:hypothetical protein|tara:strand:+ start:580 stop:960 length:381 start_codon:yes stop_codon:yes gene_type:complete
MRIVLSILIAMLSIGAFAQDTIQVPQVELDGIIEAIDTLVEQDSINNLIILSLETEVRLFETIIKQDSLVLAYKQEQIVLLESQIQLYDDRLNQVDKWYDKRPFGVVIGVLGTIGLIHVIGYTLPE